MLCRCREGLDSKIKFTGSKVTLKFVQVEVESLEIEAIKVKMFFFVVSVSVYSDTCKQTAQFMIFELLTDLPWDLSS